MRGPARALLRAFRLLLWAAAIVVGLAVGDVLLEFSGAKWWILHRIYSDLPRLELATSLDKPLAFRARILDKRQYLLRLLVHYENQEQRAVAVRLLGEWGARTKTSVDSGLPTQFHVVVRDDSGRIVHDESGTSIGWHGSGSGYLVRGIDAFILSRGIYFIEVTPIGDFSAFRDFRTTLELGTYAKATPIRD